MRLKQYSAGFLIFLLVSAVQAFASISKAQESDQQINDFSLSGFGDKGRKTWDLSGKSADIFANNVKLKDIVGNFYTEKENVKLMADSGDFNKAEGNVHLEQNVVITTDSGARLSTNSLDWDRKNEVVTTKDAVNIQKENMVAEASGATAQPNLNKIALEKDVQVSINPDTAQKPAATKNKIIITCDGPLNIDYEKNIAVFNNNVKVDQEGSQIYSDVMDVYFGKPDKNAPAQADKMPGLGGTKIDKIVARGNVKIVKGENISYSDEATYTAFDKRIMLSGRPKLEIYSTEDLGASFGN